MRAFAFVLALLSQIGVVGSAYAWGDRGHRLIADLAYEYLTPQARAEVDGLVAQDFSASPGCPIRSFGDAAVWSDCVRAIPSYRNQSSWHYDNIPLCGGADYETYCAHGDCATAAIARALRTLSNARASLRDRQRALARLVHFVGDIHQPLHASDNHDRGGNEVATRFVGGWSQSDASNLHAVWDSALVDYALPPGQAAQTVLQQLSQPNRAAWTTGAPFSWAAESHDLARRYAYASSSGALSCSDAPANLTLDRAYADAAAPIVRMQLAKAGLRLAALLNAAFAQ